MLAYISPLICTIQVVPVDRLCNGLLHNSIPHDFEQFLY